MQIYNKKKQDKERYTKCTDEMKKKGAPENTMLKTEIPVLREIKGLKKNVVLNRIKREW